MSDAYRQIVRDMDRAARRVRRLSHRWMRFLWGMLKSVHVDP